MRRSILALLVAACTAPEDDTARDTDDPYAVTPGPYAADVRWTSYGIPHIRAEDLGSAAFGMGYVFARDHACVLADQVVKVRGERSRWFGRGVDDANIDSDFGWRALGPLRDAEALWFGLPEPMQQTLMGYAAGYNRWLEEGTLPPACADAPWVRPLTHIDIATYALALGLDGSGAVWVPEIGRAQPPAGPAASRAPGSLERLHEIGNALRDPRRGSNGWAIGRDRAAGDGGMLLSNTHFPALGEKQWHELHVTVPGLLDVYGVSLMGVPVVNMGFNEHVAWTHTVSYAPRFVGYFLTLDPADPTKYLFDGTTRAMTSETHVIEVADGQGGLTEERRTLWRSHYGPILDAPLVGWSDSLAITYRDVNAQNTEMFDVWLGMNQAGGLDELVDVHRETQAAPWVYTMAAGADGRIFFGDTSRVPYLDEAALEAWQASLSGSGLPAIVANAFADFGVIGVDGSDPKFAWVEDPDAAKPGIVPWAKVPQEVRTDYAFNSNDSHWLHNVDAPLTGFSQPLYGPERTPRSARTRMNARYLSETGEGSASGPDGRFTLDELEAAAVSMRSVLVEEAKDAVVARCTQTPTVEVEGADVDLSAACAVLEAWDGRYTVDARGAVLWREFLGSGRFDVAELGGTGGGLFSVAFDPDEPVGTPRTVADAPAEAPDPVLLALADSVAALESAGWALDVRLGDVQFMPFADDTRTGLPGAGYWEGTIGIADYSGGATTTLLPRYTRGEVLQTTTERTADGYPVNNGNSWILAVSFEPTGPQARAAMVYSQSEDPASPHLHDQTALYASGQLRDVAFTEAQVAADTQEQLSLVFEAAE